MDNAIKQGLVKAKPIPANDTVSFSISAVIDPKTGILSSCCFFKSAEMLVCLQVMFMCVQVTPVCLQVTSLCLQVTSVCLQVTSLCLQVTSLCLQVTSVSLQVMSLYL